MKKIVFLIFGLFILLQNTNSQIKVLFDATKAETASNADWIIDADSWNLGYNPYPQEGEGNEANAQRIPTPSQDNIVSSTNETYWTGALSAWAVEAVKLGYYVETLPYDASITYNDPNNPQDLSNYDIFIICEPNILFSTSEKEAILNFVYNGGGLFIIADHNNSDRNGDGYDSPYILNDLMSNNPVETNPFGIYFDYEYFTETTTNINQNTPLTDNIFGLVSQVEFYGGTSMRIFPSKNPSVQAAVYRSNNASDTSDVLCAFATWGDGKVVAIGDSSPADDGTGDYNDNLYNGWTEDANGNHRKLFMNATYWLAQKNTYAEKNIFDVSFINKNGNISILINEKFSAAYLNIFDLQGRTILSAPLKPFVFNSFDLSNKKGIFLYQIFSADGNILKTGKFSVF